MHGRTRDVSGGGRNQKADSAGNVPRAYLRASRIDANMAAFCSSVKACVMSVAMKPGATQLTVILRLPSSRASRRLRPATPFFGGAVLAWPALPE